MDQQNSIVGWPAKVVSAWALIGITSWSEAAAFIAFLYSSCLLAEWVFKKIIKPTLVSRGYMKASVADNAGDDDAD
jgi:hypothetical protein